MAINNSFSFGLDRRQSLKGLAALAASSAVTGIAKAAVSTSFFNRRIHDEAHQKIGELAKNRISSIAFTPSDGWVITTLDGPFFARNIPDECYEKLGEFVRSGHKINCVAFPRSKGNKWVITEKGGQLYLNDQEVYLIKDKQLILISYDLFADIFEFDLDQKTLCRRSLHSEYCRNKASDTQE